MRFYKGNFTQLWLDLQSNEVLGILDTEYIEDYNGTDGAISLYHVDSGVRYSVAMTEVVSESPATPHDYFRGSIDLNSIPLGLFQVQCRVKDILDNYTIVGAVSSPIGTERTMMLEIEVFEGFGTVYAVRVGPLTMRAGLDVSVARLSEQIRVRRESASEVLVNRNAEVIRAKRGDSPIDVSRQIEVINLVQ